jgi:AcrR family transcriptional regulator
VVGPVTEQDATPGGVVPARRRRSRGSITRQAILDGARAVVEEEGLRALSMPTLARRLDCGVMSLYHHVHSKDALVEALTAQIMTDLHRRLPPAGDGPWADELVAYFMAYRDAMDTMPAYREVVLYAPLYALRPAFTADQLLRLDTGIGLLRRAGLPPADASAVYNVCFTYTRSFVALEHGETARPRDDAASAGPGTTPLAGGPYANLTDDSDVDDALRLDADGFRRGLELLVAGITHRYG